MFRVNQYTLLGTNASPPSLHFCVDDFPFPMVGHVSSGRVPVPRNLWITHLRGHTESLGGSVCDSVIYTSVPNSLNEWESLPPHDGKLVNLPYIRSIST